MGGTGAQGGLLKGHVLHRKSMESEEPGSGPHSLIKLCDLGHSPPWTSVSPSEERGGRTYLQACSLESHNKVVVRRGALVPEGLGVSPGSSPCYYDNCVVLSTYLDAIMPWFPFSVKWS